MVIGYYSGPVIYDNLYGDMDLERRQWEGVMSASVKEFQTYAVHFNNDVKGRKVKSHDG